MNVCAYINSVHGESYLFHRLSFIPGGRLVRPCTWKQFCRELCRSDRGLRLGSQGKRHGERQGERQGERDSERHGKRQEERDREWETRVLVRRWLDRSAIKILIADICSRLIRSRRRFTFRACLHVFSVFCLNPSFIPFLVPFLCHSPRLSQTSYTSAQ